MTDDSQFRNLHPKTLENATGVIFRSIIDRNDLAIEFLASHPLRHITHGRGGVMLFVVTREDDGEMNGMRDAWQRAVCASIAYRASLPNST